VDEEMRKALLLRLSGHSMAEVAAELGLSEPEALAFVERGEREMAEIGKDDQPSEMLRTAEAFAERRRQGTFRSADFTRPLLTALAKDLKPLGFRRKGASLFREPEPGLFHTINVQTGTHYFSTPSLTYGQFTVNLSVDVQEVAEFYAAAEGDEARFGPGYGRAASARLGFLMAGEDVWWPMDGEPAASARIVLDGLESHGFAFFDRFGSRQSLEQKVAGEDKLEIQGAQPILLAALRLGRGDGAGARKVLNDYASRADLKEAHRSWVRDLIPRLGL
jgi:hypothetical protein